MVFDRPRGHVIGTMSDSDALLWTIGRDPVLRSPVVAVVVLDRPPDMDRLGARLDMLTRAVPRLRSTVAPRPLGWGPPRWVEDRHFELGLHLGHLALPPPGALRQVLDLAQQMDSTAFDPDLPLWQAMVVDGLGGDGHVVDVASNGRGAPRSGGRAAFVVKVHHSVVDGVGGIGVLGQLLDVERDAGAVDEGLARRPGSRRSVRQRLAVARLATAPVGWMASVGRAAAVEAARAVTRPAEQLGRLRDTAGSVARLIAPAPTPLSPLMRGRGLERRFEILDYPASALHDAAHASGVTLNDVFLASVFGGLARYHRWHGVDVDRLRALMPISIRSDADGIGGNRFVPARFVVDLADDAATMVHVVHDVAAGWKHAPALALSDRVAQLLDHLPPDVATAVFGGMLKGSDVVATNVPGPPVETFLAGAHVDRIFAFAPPSGASMSVALLTPAERVCVGVNIDHAAVPDSTTLVDCLDSGFADVVRLARASRPRQATRRGRTAPLARTTRTTSARTGVSRTGSSRTGTSRARTSRAGASRTRTSPTGTSRTGTSRTGGSRTGASRTGASRTGTSRARTSRAGASHTGTSRASPARPAVARASG